MNDGTPKGNGTHPLTPEQAEQMFVDFGRNCQRLLAEIVNRPPKQGPHPQGVYREIKKSPLVHRPQPKAGPIEVELVAVALPVNVVAAMIQAGSVVSDAVEMRRREATDDD